MAVNCSFYLRLCGDQFVFFFMPVWGSIVSFIFACGAISLCPCGGKFVILCLCGCKLFVLFSPVWRYKFMPASGKLVLYACVAVEL